MLRHLKTISEITPIACELSDFRGNEVYAVSSSFGAMLTPFKQLSESLWVYMELLPSWRVVRKGKDR